MYFSLKLSITLSKSISLYNCPLSCHHLFFFTAVNMYFSLQLSITLSKSISLYSCPLSCQHVFLFTAVHSDRLCEQSDRQLWESPVLPGRKGRPHSVNSSLYTVNISNESFWLAFVSLASTAFSLSTISSVLLVSSHWLPQPPVPSWMAVTALSFIMIGWGSLKLYSDWFRSSLVCSHWLLQPPGPSWLAGAAWSFIKIGCGSLKLYSDWLQQPEALFWLVQQLKALFWLAAAARSSILIVAAA